MPNPFTNRSMITDRRQFYGRAEQLERIFDRLNGSQPGSVSVVGERRIGRSSLLYHVKLVAPERLVRPDAFRFVYVDLQSDVITSPDSFRGYALARLIGAGDAQGSDPGRRSRCVRAGAGRAGPAARPSGAAAR